MWTSNKSKSTSALSDSKKDEKAADAPSTTKTVTINEPKKDSKDAADPKKPSGESKSNEPKERMNSFSREAIRALSGKIMDAILDIRVSTTDPHEQELSRNGYLQLLQDTNKKATAASTFGNKSSLWVWRRSQGTCSGRLKPIIDIILDASANSSELVLAGYTCDPIQISGQSFWVKRATTEEEEKDAVIDLYVTTGKMKDPSDPIWQSPGVGWVRVDGNFSRGGFFSSIDSFLWYRPARTRAPEQQLINPIKGSVALTEEIRQTKLIAAVRIGLRHYIPVRDIKRLATLVMESNQVMASNAVKETIRSERMMDFSTVFHFYAAKGKLYPNKWSKMLTDVGIRLKPADVTQVFNFFDANHNGFISIEEFTSILALTDYELDLALDKIRLKLLLPCIPKDILKVIPVQTKEPAMKKQHSGLIGDQSSHPYIGKNKIRESITLMQIFSMVNIKKDNILSLDELMDLASKVEVFVTEDEARKLITQMDVNGDDRVEEPDFIAFMRKESVALMKKAFRIREAANFFRRWLVHGTSEKIDNTSSATASKAQWKWFKTRYEKSLGQKFPGYLSSPVLQSTLLALGVRLSAVEAREFTLLVAPEKTGRVHLADLHSFMGRSCRSIGELVALVERDIFPDLLDAYRAHSNAIKLNGREDSDLAGLFNRKLEEIKKFIENVYSLQQRKAQAEANAASNPSGAGGSNTANNNNNPTQDEDEEENIPIPTMAVNQSLSQDLNRFLKGTHEVISLNHLKTGIQEWILRSANPKKLNENNLPNLEEWGLLCVLVDAGVAEGDVYGMKLKNFLQGICAYISNSNEETRIKTGEKISLEIIARELKLQIFREAKLSAIKNNAKKPDYLSVFQLFDENKNGSISLNEFKTMLKKLQLISALSDHQIPNLLAMFDKNKRGVITFDDFKNFAEEGEKIAQDEDDYFFKSNRFLLLSGNPSSGGGDKKSDSKKLTSFLDGDDDELDPEDLADELDLISDIPPTAVTGNADCNWLIWFLYRSACHLEPMDPESVIIDLESLCHETEMTTNEQDISIKELWNILFELKLQGNMSKTQYLKGIQVLSLHGNNRDDDRVDYSTLCKYVIRMGRSYNGLLQERRKEMEKNFHPLLIELKKYFKQLCEEGKDDKKDEIPRFEKIFRRLDNDGDGMITPKEFKIGLKKLQYKDYKAWNMLMVRRLFDECDKNKDGLLSIKEFLVYILDRQPADARGLRDSSNKNNNNNSSSNGPLRSSDKQDRLRDLDDERNDPLQLSDDEQDEIFRKKRTLTDHELFRKVNEILMDIVPDEFPNNPQKHLEMIRSSVRRFFQRADPEYKGYVSEERFRAFLRRSGLQDRLTANELRRFTEKLKKKGTGKERYESLIDYEKLVNQLLVVTESIPKSKAEVVFTRLQDAAIASANAGRSFLNLCSLTDLHLTGFLTKEELMHTTKMMDYPMNAYDVEALCELLPNHAVTKDNRIDYRILNTILQSYSPREQFMRDLDYSNVNNSNLNNRRPNALSLSGALPSYATPGAVTNVFVDPIYGNSGVRNSNPNFISTPLGQSINSPQRGLYAGANTNSWDDLTRLNLGVGGGGGNNLPPGTPILGGGAGLGLNNNIGAGGVYEKIIRSLAERIRYAIQDRNFHLQNNNSYTPSSSSSPIPYNIRKRMENNDLHNSGMISIRTLQYLLEELGVILTSTELQVIHSYYGKVNEPDHIFYDSFCRLIENTPILDRNNGNNMGMNDSFSNPVAMDNSPIYFNGKVLMKYKELKEHGKELFDLFEFYDVDRKGKILSNKFKEVLVKAQLLQSEFQLVKAMEDFSTVGNRSYVEYQDFCDAMDRALARFLNMRGSQGGGGNNRRSVGIADGDGFDGMHNDDNNYYNEGPGSRNNSRPSSRSRGMNYPDREEDGRFYDYALSPPKVTDSANFTRSRYNNSGPSSPRGSYNSGVMSPRGSLERNGSRWSNGSAKDMLQVARTSPSKMGTKVWGNETPLAKKGRVPDMDDDSKWCCAVCLYVENPISAERCLVCDSPNYAMRKDYQVKEQCRNCTFLNGQFAEECEMCGEPLSHGLKKGNSSKGGHASASSSAKNRYGNDSARGHRDEYRKDVY